MAAKAAKSKSKAKTRKVTGIDNKQHRDLADEYLVNGRNKVQAYLKVYPKAKYDSARTTAPAIFAEPSIVAYIEEREAELAEKYNITRERILQEVARLAFVDVRKLFTESGALKAMHELDDDTAAALASIDTEELSAGSGDSRESIGRVRKVRLHDKPGSLRDLMKHLGMFEKDAISATPAPVNVTVNIRPDEAYMRLISGASKAK